MESADLSCELPETTARHSLLDRTPPRWLLLVLLCLALFVRGRAVLSNVDSLAKDPDAYGDVAWHIAHDHALAYWQGNRVVLTASRAPLYPLVLSIFEMLPLKTDPYGYAWLHVMLGVGTVWCAWRLGLAWGLPPGGALLAAGLVAVDPILLGQSAQLMTETLATFLVALVLVALGDSSTQVSSWRALWIGVILALAVLCRPSLCAWAVLVAGVFAWRAAVGRQWLPAALLMGATIGLLAPWAARNQRVFGRPIFTTTHGGYTLLLANNPEFYDFLLHAPWGATWDAKDLLQQWRAKQELIDTPDGPALDEVAADAWAYEQAWNNMRNEPLVFAYSCLARWGRLWNVLPHQTSADESPARRGLRYAVAVWYAFELPLALVGAWIWRRKTAAPPLLWGVLLVVSLVAVHAFYWTDMRMRAPLVIVVALLATQGALWLAGQSRDSKRLPQAV